MLFLGIFSFLERVFLASVQYRQGPSSVMLNGFSQVIADGIKLYSKFNLDFLPYGMTASLTGCSFALLTGLGMVYYTGNLTSVICFDLDILTCIIFLEMLSALTALPLIVAPSKYVLLGSLRHMRVLILASILLETALIML